MKLRTSNIILITKGNHNYFDEEGRKLSPKNAIKRYMSITCDCPEENYNEARIAGIVENVVLDYLSTTSEAEKLIRDYLEWSKFIKERQFFKDKSYQDKTDVDAWLTALNHIQVRNESGYMNGFNDYNIKVWDENTAGEKLLFPEEI